MPENFPNEFERLEVARAVTNIESAVTAAGILDREPYSLMSTVRDSFCTNTTTDSEYYVETARVRLPSVDMPPNENESVKAYQKFGLNEQGTDKDIIIFSKNSKGVELLVDRTLFAKVDSKSISLFDRVNYSSMAGLIDLLKTSSLDSQDILKEPGLAWFMDINTRWITEESPISSAIYTHFLINEGGDLVKVRTSVASDGRATRSISIGDSKNPSLPKIVMTKDGSTRTTEVLEPKDKATVISLGSLIPRILESSTLY